MIRFASYVSIVALLTLAALGFRTSVSHSRAGASSPATIQVEEPIQPIRRPALDSAVVRLGRDLFHDGRLSRDNSVSCASCHDLGRGGADGLPHSVGIGRAVGNINAPTVLNSSLNFRQFWDGRAASLEEQVNGPIAAKPEMGSSWDEILAKLRRDPELTRRFRRHYPDGIDEPNVRDAIATFERSLVTPSRFDRYLLGEHDAISANEREGYEIFKNYGCASCHQGANVGGNMYQTSA